MPKTKKKKTVAAESKKEIIPGSVEHLAECVAGAIELYSRGRRVPAKCQLTPKPFVGSFSIGDEDSPDQLEKDTNEFLRKLSAVIGNSDTWLCFFPHDQIPGEDMCFGAPTPVQYAAATVGPVQVRVARKHDPVLKQTATRVSVAFVVSA